MAEQKEELRKLKKKEPKGKAADLSRVFETLAAATGEANENANLALKNDLILKEQIIDLQKKYNDLFDTFEKIQAWAMSIEQSRLASVSDPYMVNWGGADEEVSTESE